MITINGGIITRINDSMICFKLECKKCGAIESTESRVIVSVGITEVSTRKCPNCGCYQTIKIKHIVEETANT